MIATKVMATHIAFDFAVFPKFLSRTIELRDLEHFQVEMVAIRA